jgi:hypothetical protein
MSDMALLSGADSGGRASLGTQRAVERIRGEI